MGGPWNGSRRRAPYHSALEGIDELAFLRSVVRRAEGSIGRELSGVYVVGYSNGGHLVFRLALEDPGEFDALATIGAHLPVAEDRDCTSSGVPVPMLLISGTADPANLPYPTAKFPADVVGRTSRDLDGARAIWRFFARHRRGG